MDRGSTPPEPFGERVGRLRVQAGLTQAALAAKISLSRVMVSHIEAGLAWPNERTVLLMAGVFRVEPPELVAETSYPPAKAARLPLTAMRFTQADLDAELLGRDLRWLALVPVETRRDLARKLVGEWECVAAGRHAAAGPEGAERTFAALYRRLIDEATDLPDRP